MIKLKFGRSPMGKSKVEATAALLDARREYLGCLKEEEAGLVKKLADAVQAGADDAKCTEIEKRLVGLPRRMVAAETAIVKVEDDLVQAKQEEIINSQRQIRAEMAEINRLALVLALAQAEHKKQDRDIGLLLRKIEMAHGSAVLRLAGLGDTDSNPHRQFPLGIYGGSPMMSAGARDISPDALAHRLREMIRKTGVPAFARSMGESRFPEALSVLSASRDGVPPAVAAAVQDVRASLDRSLKEEGIVPAANHNGRGR
jgi:hypothetical protein